MELLENYFNTAFNAPDGIKKLRELILTLAMQGKLVPQDANDQPASELLEEIEAEKKRLVKEGKIKEPKPLPEIKPEEVPYELPKGWEWVRLISIGYWAIGSGFPLNIQGDSTQEIFLCKVSDMNIPGNEKYIYSVNNTISEAKAKKNKINIHEAGTIVFPKIGGAIATNKRRILSRKTAIDNNCLGIVPHKQIDLEWSYQLLSLFDFSKYQSGTSVPAISQGVIGSIVVGLPPLAEQRRIVAKIDQLISRCDELEKLRAEHGQKLVATHTAALNRLLTATEGETFSATWDFITQNVGELYSVKENVAELRKAILQLAVMGKLVPQNANDRPPSELLKETEAEKKRQVKAGKIRSPEPFPEIKSDEVPFELPERWEWVRLGELGEAQTGTTPPKKDSENFGNHIPFIGPGDIKNYVIDYSGEGLSEIGISRGRLIEKDSVLMVCIGGSIGKHAVNDRNISCNQQINTITPYKRDSVKYLFYTMGTQYFQKMVLSQAGGSATPIINKQKWSSIPVPLPPAIEQRRIVAKIDQLMARCDELEKQIDAAAGRQTALLNAVMAQV